MYPAAMHVAASLRRTLVLEYLKSSNSWAAIKRPVKDFTCSVHSASEIVFS